MRKRALRMSPAVAGLAVRTERMRSVAPVRCMMRFALSAELLLRCLSSPKRTVRFTATSAIRLCADNVQIKTACKIRRGIDAASYFFRFFPLMIKAWF